MCSETIAKTPSVDPLQPVQLGVAKVCISCMKVPTWAAFDAKRCNHCHGRVFVETEIEIKHPMSDYKRPDIYEGDGANYVPEWMQREDDY